MHVDFRTYHLRQLHGLCVQRKCLVDSVSSQKGFQSALGALRVVLATLSYDRVLFKSSGPGQEHPPPDAHWVIGLVGIVREVVSTLPLALVLASGMRGE